MIIVIYIILKIISIPLVSYFDSIRYDWEKYSRLNRAQEKNYSIDERERKFMQEYQKPSDRIIEFSYSLDSFGDFINFNTYMMLIA